jgi:hypothetical protein
VYLFELKDGLLLGGSGCGGGLDDGERSFEADGCGSVRVGENLVEALDGQVELGFHAFTEVEGAVVLGVGESLLEREKVATPVEDSVAMNAGLFGGGRGGCAG